MGLHKEVLGINELFFELVNFLSFIHIEPVSANHLIDAVSHVKLVHVSPLVAKVRLRKGCTIEFSALPTGPSDEVCLQELFHAGSLPRFMAHGHHHELFQFFRACEPDRLLEILELLVAFVGHTPGHEEVEDHTN